MIDVEGHLLGPNSGAGRGTQVEMGVWTDVCRRESDLKDARVAQRIAHATLLPRDRQLMDALSMNELMDNSVVNAIWVSSRAVNATHERAYEFD